MKWFNLFVACLMVSGCCLSAKADDWPEMSLPPADDVDMELITVDGEASPECASLADDAEIRRQISQYYQEIALLTQEMFILAPLLGQARDMELEYRTRMTLINDPAERMAAMMIYNNWSQLRYQLEAAMSRIYGRIQSLFLLIRSLEARLR